MPSEKKKSRERKTMVTQEETPQNDTPLLNPQEVMLKFMQDFSAFISQQQQQQQSLSTPHMDSSSSSSIKGLVDFLKIAPKPFVGTTNPVEAENWIDEMEKAFQGSQCPEKEKVDYAVYLLQDSARHWWKSVERNEKDEEPSIGLSFVRNLCQILSW